MKLAVLGGTFNPIHNGHLLIAEESRIIFEFDKVLFIPTNIPPHKDFTQRITDDQRMEMISLAIASNPFFESSDMEIKRGGVSYTIDTVNELYQNYEIEGKIHLILGGDLINDLFTWRSYEELVKKVQLVVVNRGNYKISKDIEDLPFIQTTKTTPFHVTSTLIRERILEEKSIRYLVPESVENYIRTNNLYQN